jgi:hypothetical protein
MKPLRAYLLAYPMVLPLAFYATWLAGRWSLGHWPRPSLDDPKSLGAMVDIPYAITFLLLFVGLPAFAVAVLALVGESWRNGSRRAGASLISAVALTSMIASIAFLRWDPLRVGEWFFD